MLEFNLQRFANDDKTEPATPKRRKQQRDEGNVPHSRDMVSAITFLIALYVLKTLGTNLWNTLYLNWQYDFSHVDTTSFTTTGIFSLWVHQLYIFAHIIYPLILIPMAVGLFINFAQIRFLFVPSILIPKLDRINPMSGFRKIFGFQGVVSGSQSVLKLSIIAGFVYLSVQGLIPQIENLLSVSAVQYPAALGTMIFGILLKIGIGLVLLSVIDYIYQKLKFEKGIKMTKEEIKDERKQADGDPKIKGHIRKRGRQIAMSRMMQKVPKADVVITNPTHFAVALQYEAGTAAPVVVAKGQDELALRIRSVAEEHGVPVVENKPLARELHKLCDVDDAVPRHLFKAVAKLLAQVYQMKNRRVGK